MSRLMTQFKAIYLVKCWWLPLILLLISITLYIVVARLMVSNSSSPDKLIDLLISLAGWLLALAGLLFSAQNVLRGLMFQALLKLHEDEAAPEQRTAKKLVSRIGPPKGFKDGDNIYSYVRERIKQLSDEEREELDKARHRMTHFWYRAARLVDLGIVDAKEVFNSVGPPDILKVLEPLEAIQAESIDFGWKPRPWPPATMLIAWYKQDGQMEKANGLQPEVPANKKVYDQSKASVLPERIDKLRTI